MIGHATPERVAVAREATFAQPPDNWTAEGQVFYCTERNIEGLKREVLKNENYRVRSNAVHLPVLGLRSGSTFSFGRYITGLPTTAAAGEQAAQSVDGLLYQCALGGLRRGFAADFTGEGTKAAPKVPAEQGEKIEVGDWIFGYSTSLGRGEFFQVVAKPEADTLELDRELFFEPTAQDKAHAVVVAYFHQGALTRHDHPDHVTLGFMFQGEELAGDRYQARGCKLNMTIDTIEPGAMLRARFEGKAAGFEHEELAELDNVALTNMPAGNDPLVASIGDRTTVKLGKLGEALADVPLLGGLEPTIGIGHEQVRGVNGYEGVHGYMATGWGECGVALSTYHDPAWRVAFNARTEHRLLVQVGARPKRAAAVYWPRLVLKEDPTRGAVTQLTANRLAFQALEHEEGSEIECSACCVLLVG